MSEANSIYLQARVRADEINRDHYDGRMTYEEAERAVRAFCHAQVAERMRQETEPVTKLMIEAANISITPGPLELPASAKEYLDHVEKRWAGVWDQIVNKRF